MTSSDSDEQGTNTRKIGARVRLVAATRSWGLELLGVAAGKLLPFELGVGELFRELWLDKFEEPRKRRFGGLSIPSSSEADANAEADADAEGDAWTCEPNRVTRRQLPE